MSKAMSVWSEIGGFFVHLFKGIFSAGEVKTLEDSLIAFVKTDVGKLAVDAVEYVEGALPNGGGIDKRDAAVAKLKADAAAAGKDLETLGLSTLHWFIETALQAVLTKAIQI